MIDMIDKSRVQGGHDLDQKWADTSILLVGIGGVGCPLAQALVRSGIGRLTLKMGTESEIQIYTVKSIHRTRCPVGAS